MPLTNPSLALLEAPLAELRLMLLKQFHRLLQERGLALTHDVMIQLSLASTEESSIEDGSLIANVQRALRDVVAESQTVLQERFGLRFEHSLMTDMQQIGGWETTAEFLEIANIKSNAELRISAGTTLLAFFGDAMYATHLISVLEQDGGIMDVDATLARRALFHLTGIDADSSETLAQLRQQITRLA